MSKYAFGYKTTEFDHPGVTLWGWQDVKIQVLTNF